MPEISVIIPVYNTSAYLQECVDSVLAQTFQDFEVIIVDDCSTDGSWELVNRLYGENDKVSLGVVSSTSTLPSAMACRILSVSTKWRR